MFLKINTFKRLIKKSLKGMGLTVGNDGEGIYLGGGHWSIWLARIEMTNKAKAAIIELTGGLPSEGTAYRAWEGEGVQFEMTELYDPEIYRPEIRNFKIKYKETGVILIDPKKEYTILQDTNNYKCIMINRDISDMVDFGSREKGESVPVGPLGRYGSIYGRPEVFWQNEVCTLRVAAADPEEREGFVLNQMEMWDFSEDKRNEINGRTDEPGGMEQ